jgi:hypothetical protein
MGRHCCRDWWFRKKSACNRRSVWEAESKAAVTSESRPPGINIELWNEPHLAVWILQFFQAIKRSACVFYE